MDRTAYTPGNNTSAWYYMLGDQIGEEKGKITSQRVLDVEGGMSKMETSFSATGSLKA